MKNMLSRIPSLRTAAFAVTVGTLALGFAATASSEEEKAQPTLQGRRIAYVLSNDHWAAYASPEKKECPNGFNDGPREQFVRQFPKDGQKRTVMETELARESAIWFPTRGPDPLPFSEPVSTVAPGLNLDGKVGKNDFTSPEGTKGIDNQFYRVVGCTLDYRPGGSLFSLQDQVMRLNPYRRVAIELTNVDSLVNDDDVDVAVYRTLDPLITDASGNSLLPYGTQRVDVRRGKAFERHFKGKIVNGVLTTEPTDTAFPYDYYFQDFEMFTMKAARLQIALTPESAKGFWAGYLDVDSWYRSLIMSLGTHTMSFGGQAGSSMYKALTRNADGYPDPKTGEFTAISAAKDVVFKQVFIIHPEAKVAAN